MVWCKGCVAERSKRYYAEHRAERAAKYAAKRVEKPPKICKACGIRETISRRHGYCRDCHMVFPPARKAVRESRRNRNSPEKARKYGAAHVTLRNQLKRVVDAGQAVCARCGERIVPGTPWDLGHVDGTNMYQGAEHRSCNRATSRKRAQSRRW